MDCEKTLINRMEKDLDKAQVVYNIEHLGGLENYCYYRYSALSEKKIRGDKNESIKFSVVMPVYNTVSHQLCSAIESVLNQTYDNFELVLVDDCSTWKNVKKDIERYKEDYHVRVIFREKNGGISECTNTGLSMVSGDYIAFMDCDDLLEEDALYEFSLLIRSHPEYDYIYSDQDNITEDGLIKHTPFFKPEWSPTLFASEMYTNHLSVYRTSIVKSIGGFISKYDGAQDYDFTFRFMEQSDDKRVGHIPKILYHWRERRESTSYSIASKEYVFEADRKVKQDMLARRNIKGHLKFDSLIKRNFVEYEVIGEPLVSIIVYGDETEKIKECLECVCKYTEYANFEILFCNATKDDVEELLSLICYSKGEYILFLDADVRVSTSEWLEVLLAQAQQRKVGAVGAKILFKDSQRIRHCGISLVEGRIDRDFEGLDEEKTFYFDFTSVVRDCTAISMECLLLSKEKYYKVGGLDKKSAGNVDIALCLGLLKNGYYNVIRNDVVLDTEKDYEESDGQSEIVNDYIKERYREYVSRDYYLNANLKSYSKNLDIRVIPQRPETGCDLTNVQKGYGLIERIDCSDSIRISGFSYIEDIAEKPLNRYLLIAKNSDKFGRVKVVDVPRVDMLNMNNMEKKHLWDGFITYVSRDELLQKPQECSFYIEYEYENKVVRTVLLKCNEDTPEERDNKRIAEFVADKCVYIYGAGNYGMKCYRNLQQLGINVEAFIVSEKREAGNRISGLEIKSLDDVKNMDRKEEIGIFVALKPLFRNQVIPELRKCGFFNLFMYPTDIF